jgi:hypothetical protein
MFPVSATPAPSATGVTKARRRPRRSVTVQISPVGIGKDDAQPGGDRDGAGGGPAYVTRETASCYHTPVLSGP